MYDMVTELHDVFEVVTVLRSSTTEGGRMLKKLKLHASLTASDSSTIAEEIVVLLRRLHPLPSWNMLINQYISASLQSIPRIILPAAEDPTYSHRRRKREGSHNREEQVCECVAQPHSHANPSWSCVTL